MGCRAIVEIRFQGLVVLVASHPDLATLDLFRVGQDLVVLSGDLLLVGPVLFQTGHFVDNSGVGERVELAAHRQDIDAHVLGDLGPLEDKSLIAPKPLLHLLVSGGHDHAVPEELVAFEGVIESHPQHQNDLEALLLGHDGLPNDPRFLLLVPEVGRIPVALLGIDGDGYGIETTVVQGVDPGAMVGLIDLDASQKEVVTGGPEDPQGSQRQDNDSEDQIATQFMAPAERTPICWRMLSDPGGTNFTRPGDVLFPPCNPTDCADWWGHSGSWP